MKTNKKVFTGILVLIAIITISCALPTTIGNTVKNLLGDKLPSAEEAQEIVEQLPGADQAEEIVEQVLTPESVQESVEQAQEVLGDLVTTITGNDTSMLDNYRSTFVLNAQGKDDADNDITQKMEMQQEVNSSQSIYHNKLHAEGTGIDTVEGDLDLYVIGESTYMYTPATPEYPCILLSGGTDSLADMEYLKPEDFFETIETDQLLERGVTVNGIVSDHYSVKSSGMEMQETYSESGEIWIAQTDGYIVRYIGTAEGRFDTGDQAGTGSLTWEYNLFDVGKVQVIELPVECRDQQATVDEVPVPDSAVNKEILAGIITFESPDSPQQVGDFYRDQLPKEGWRITEDSAVASLVMMSAEKDSQTLQIMISPGDGAGSSVIISTIPLQ